MASTEIPKSLAPALRAIISVAFPFIFFLIALERLFEGHHFQALACFIAAVLSFLVAVYWEHIIPNRFQEKPKRLEYLHYKDSELGAAVRDMVWRSAWAKWYSAQCLVNSRQPAPEPHVLQIATHSIMQNLVRRRS